MPPTGRPPRHGSRSTRSCPSPRGRTGRSSGGWFANLTAEAGIRRFLDIGTGIPTAGNTHEVAQAIAPQSRVVYVDYDLVVLAHARALLNSNETGATEHIDADLRDTGKILAQAARLLDFSQPVAVTLLSILHAIPDADDRAEDTPPRSKTLFSFV